MKSRQNETSKPKGSSHSEQFLRKRKMMLTLPILILPFLTLLFWTLGGGKGVQAEGLPTPAQTGLNLELPAANLKDDAGWTKLDYYRQADEDSARRLEQMKRDPYYNLPIMATQVADTNALLLIKDRAVTYQPSAPKSVFSGGTSEEMQEMKVQQKLRDLDQQLKAQSTAAYSSPGSRSSTTPFTSLSNDGPKPRKLTGKTAMQELIEEEAELSPEMHQLQGMMADMEAIASAPDSDIKELSGMIDKLTDLQFPERVREKMKAASENSKGKVFAVRLPDTDNITVLESRSPSLSSAESTQVNMAKYTSQPSAHTTVHPSVDSLLPVLHVASTINGFYGLDDETVLAEGIVNTIPAVIHETQILVNGATVKLRVLQDIYINGVEVRAGNFIYGLVQLSGDRLNITVSSIRSGNNILPVMLAVYDMDGLAGVSIPGAITRDVAKQSAGQSIQQIGMSALDPSIGVQAASAGIELGKNLLSKKVKLVKVTIKAGYQVLLKDNQTKSS